MIRQSMLRGVRSIAVVRGPRPSSPLAQIVSNQLVPVHSLRRDDENKPTLISNLNQIRSFHSSHKNQSVVLACIGVAGAAIGASVVLDSVAKRSAERAAQAAQEAAAAAAGGPAAGEAKKEDAGGNPFNSLFGSIFGAKTFYQGGFEEKMTKREAALILGVRESASREKIRESHRYLSRVNHPDTGGSEFLAMKINEAKDMLLGSK